LDPHSRSHALERRLMTQSGVRCRPCAGPCRGAGRHGTSRAVRGRDEAGGQCAPSG
jgi:hypothetical protein